MFSAGPFREVLTSQNNGTNIATAINSNTAS
jgi:hypothetical protein